MTEPVTRFNLNTAAGLIVITADYEGSQCKAVSFDNLPFFAHALDYKMEVPGLGTVSVHIVWGGMHYVLDDASSAGLVINNECGTDLIRVG
ncbi:hypothetical protein SLS55_004650 [Diplodia seriata]|uniref:trans-L-3-hydroxyproline dehydratase n=1 Tax=Diplodia seriata TaxID=420778 RepID=A0ABR3CJZ4_9PEZI